MSLITEYLTKRRRIQVDGANIDLEGSMNDLIESLSDLKNQMGVEYYDISGYYDTIDISFFRYETEPEYNARIERENKNILLAAENTRQRELKLLRELKAKYECMESRQMTL